MVALFRILWAEDRLSVLSIVMDMHQNLSRKRKRRRDRWELIPDFVLHVVAEGHLEEVRNLLTVGNVDYSPC